MFHEKIKALFSSAVDSVASTISKYSVHPDKDFTRQKKLPPDKLITFLVSQGSSSTSEELLEFFDLDADAPSVSALNQQRAKLKPEAMEAVFHHFHSSLSSLEGADGYESIAADGSTFSFFSKPTFASPDYFVSEGHSAKGFYSLHLNALYNLDKHIYTDALIQPIHNKDEYRAFATLVDRHQTSPWKKTIFIGDRGYCSYNNMAHVLKKGQFFLFRAKDIHSKGLLSGFDFPDKESFDIRVRVTLVRSQSKKIAVEGYRRFVDKATSFDFIEYGTRDTYQLTFRIVRFPISESTYECLVTNLPEEEFPPKRLKELYFSRWGVLYEPCFYMNFCDGNTINIKFSITKSSYKVLSLIQESETVRLRHLAIMVLLLESHCFFCLRFLSSGLTMVMYSGLLLFSCPHALIAPRSQRDPRHHDIASFPLCA